jgi:hypothetical protein
MNVPDRPQIDDTRRPFSPRLEGLRDAIATTVSADGYSRKPRTRKTVFAAVGAFALAGALSGSLTAAAASSSNANNAMEGLMQTVATANLNSIGGKLTGPSRFEILSGNSVVDPGVRPHGANAIEVSFQCVDPGTFSQYVTGTAASTPLPCTSDKMTIPSTTNPQPTTYRITGSSKTTLTTKGTDGARYAVWVSWAKVPGRTQMSAQQAADVADGVVTPTEYVSAYNRFDACMAEAGYPQIVVPEAGTPLTHGPNYDPRESIVADTVCYPREFEQVDTLWQDAHQ